MYTFSIETICKSSARLPSPILANTRCVDVMRSNPSRPRAEDFRQGGNVSISMADDTGMRQSKYVFCGVRELPSIWSWMIDDKWYKDEDFDNINVQLDTQEASWCGLRAAGCDLAGASPVAAGLIIASLKTAVITFYICSFRHQMDVWVGTLDYDGLVGWLYLVPKD